MTIVGEVWATIDPQGLLPETEAKKDHGERKREGETHFRGRLPPFRKIGGREALSSIPRRRSGRAKKIFPFFFPPFLWRTTATPSSFSPHANAL